MTSTDGEKTLSTLSPFAIYKGVKGVAGGYIYLTCIKVPTELVPLCTLDIGL